MPNILIIDDEWMVQQALAARLNAYGHTVRIAPEGVSGLAAAEESPPDVILLDIGMPAGNGFTVQERIAKVEQFANLPVVYLTGMRSPKISATAKRLGAFALLHKPCDSEVLIETVRQALNSRHELESSAAH